MLMSAGRVIAMSAMASMHKYVQERTREQNQPWQPAEQMRAVFGKEEETGDEYETQPDPVRVKRRLLRFIVSMIHIGVLQIGCHLV